MIACIQPKWGRWKIAVISHLVVDVWEKIRVTLQRINVKAVEVFVKKMVIVSHLAKLKGLLAHT
jgi:hypothetical protein